MRNRIKKILRETDFDWIKDVKASPETEKIYYFIPSLDFRELSFLEKKNIFKSVSGKNFINSRWNELVDRGVSSFMINDRGGVAGYTSEPAYSLAHLELFYDIVNVDGYEWINGREYLDMDA